MKYFIQNNLLYPVICSATYLFKNTTPIALSTESIKLSLQIKSSYVILTLFMKKCSHVILLYHIFFPSKDTKTQDSRSYQVNK